MGKVVNYSDSEDEEPKSQFFSTNDPKTIMEQRRKLPIYQGRRDLMDQVLGKRVSIIIGETGSGKSTQIAQFLLEAEPRSSIAVTQPRRVAAMSLANRVAAEMGTQVGDKVGYQVRFQAKFSPATKIRFMTDGMLMREFMLDRNLRKFSTIVIDEAHERTVVTDLLLGLLKDLLRNPKFKGRVVVMSATLDADTFSEFFDDAPIFFVPGKTFPVERFYLKAPVKNIAAGVLASVRKINHSEPTGDILVFLSGQEDIEAAAELLRESNPHLAKGEPKLIPVPLYAALSDKQQQKAFEPTAKHHRKIVLATNIAETSLTIPGIRYVLDTGLRKTRVYRTKLGLESLLPVPVSQASAAQRMGRAGREAPGKCFRLYTEDEYGKMEPFTMPEIARISVSSPVLMLKNLGVENVETFPWVQRPSKSAIKQALLELFALGAIDANQEITKLGREMVVLPLEPKLAAVLVKAKSLDKVVRDTVIDIVACLSVQDVLVTPAPNRREEVNAARSEQFPAAAKYGDLIMIKQMYDHYLSLENRERKSWCFEVALNYKAMRNVGLVKAQLRNYLKITDHSDSDEVAEFDEIIKCFLVGFSTNVARGLPDRRYQTLLTQQALTIHPSSALFGARVPAIMYLEYVYTTKGYARLVSPIELEWLSTLNLYK